MFFLICLDPLVGEIHPFGGFPISLENLHETLDQIGIAEADAQLAALVEALRVDIEGTEQSTLLIRKDQLCVEMNTVKFVHIDAEIFQETQTSNPLKDVEITE